MPWFQSSYFFSAEVEKWGALGPISLMERMGSAGFFLSVVHGPDGVLFSSPWTSGVFSSLLYCRLTTAGQLFILSSRLSLDLTGLPQRFLGFDWMLRL